MNELNQDDGQSPTWRHDKSVEDVLAALHSSSQGLSEVEAAERLRKFGPNQLRKEESASRLKILANQFRTLVIWVLVGAAIVSIALGEFLDGIAIIAIVVLNAAVGFFQEYRAEQAASALAQLTSPRARVLRDGHAQNLDATAIVPGDVLLLDAGDIIAADARLTEASSLRVNEASLTGESASVEKRVGTCPPETPLADRTNMVFLGSSIAGGSGRAIVTTTGMETEVGRISTLLESAQRDQTPLQRRIDDVAKRLLYASLGIVALVFLLGLLRSVPAFELFLSSVSLAVAAIPEGLPTVVTIALALGMQRMAKRNALVRRLAAVETLGSAQVICTDKTGTLTMGEMTVKRLATLEREFAVSGDGYQTAGVFSVSDDPLSPASDSVLSDLLYASAACNDAELVVRDDRASVVGDPTEGALLVAAAKAGVTRAGIEARAPRVHTIPFDSDRKRMTVVRERDGQLWAFVKGAPEVMLSHCTHVQTAAGVAPMTQEDLDRLRQMNARMAGDALRVLAVAQRCLARLPSDQNDAVEKIETQMTLLGLIGMEDPPRAEARDAVARSRLAGIRTVMITGDHVETARAIARELKILDAKSEVISGSELDSLSDEALRARVPQIAVYARVTAQHKLRIVRAWKKLGNVVAMTGDGVNDAPALKEASIGIAMGITGTEVTKEAADMIIADDNFASIVSAVEEGRGIYDNVVKTLAYLLAGNAGELLVMLFAGLVGWPLPLLPAQLLWINLVTDGFPALALATDPADSNVLQRGPRDPQAQLMDAPFLKRILLTGFLVACVALAAFSFELYQHDDLGRARNAVFSVLVIEELMRSFGARSRTLTVFESGWAANRRLFAVVGISLLLQVMINSVPTLQTVFGTKDVTWTQWAAWTALALVPLTVIEIRKVLQRRQTSSAT